LLSTTARNLTRRLFAVTWRTLYRVSVVRARVLQLHAKYAEMLAMRLAHDAGDEDPAETRIRMADLALRFPGALREIDDLELRTIRSRIAQLEAVLRGDKNIRPWMEALSLFHEFTRGALCAKRWLAGRKHIDLETQQEFAAQVANLTFPEEARVWANDLARLASPPRGRVTELVYARIAQALGTNEREARRLVFGERRHQLTGRTGRRRGGRRG
jgi:hypothetical protein